MKLADLYEIILDRRLHPQETSYTNHLFILGEDEILKKVGEEAVEVILAAKSQGDSRVIEESADLIYHLLVLLVYRSLPLEAIEKELGRRHRSAPGSSNQQA